jgi:hypothetical protein
MAATTGQPQREESSLEFDKRKWEEEKQFKKDDLALKKDDLALKADDLTFRKVEARRSHFWNPLVIAIIGGILTAMTSIYVAWDNSNIERRRESAEAVRDALKLDRTQQADRLEAGIQTDLIQPTEALRKYIEQQKEEPPSVAAPSTATSPPAQSNMYCYQQRNTQKRPDQMYLVLCTRDERLCTLVRGADKPPELTHTDCVSVPAGEARRFVRPGGFLDSLYAFSDKPFPQPPFPRRPDWPS